MPNTSGSFSFLPWVCRPPLPVPKNLVDDLTLLSEVFVYTWCTHLGRPGVSRGLITFESFRGISRLWSLVGLLKHRRGMNSGSGDCKCLFVGTFSCVSQNLCFEPCFQQKWMSCPQKKKKKLLWFYCRNVILQQNN